MRLAGNYNEWLMTFIVGCHICSATLCSLRSFLYPGTKEVVHKFVAVPPPRRSFEMANEFISPATHDVAHEILSAAKYGMFSRVPVAGSEHCDTQNGLR